jgi:Leucine-rich repeat (LRR) protein
MGGTAYDIEIEPIDGAAAAPPPALFHAVSNIVTEAIYAFTKRRKAYQAIRVNYDSSYGESGNTAKSLSFGFYDGGGAGMISMDALCHFFTVILAALPLEEIAERNGYRIKAKRASLDETLAKEAGHSIFVELRGAVHEVERNKKGAIVAFVDGEGDSVELNAKERALAEKALASKQCPCLVCEALRAGKRPALPKPPKPAKPKKEASDGGFARKKQVQLKDVGEFPSELLSAKRLERLSVREGGIGELPEELGDAFPHLISLDVSRTNIQRIPRSLANVPTFRSLSVMFQTLTSVDEIAEFAALKYLTLGVGPIVEKLDCAKLAHVTSLDLSRCKARALPRNIGAMTMLDTLTVSDNALEDLPAELARLPKLGSVCLNDNPTLRELPAVLRDLPLHDLYLSNTGLERLHAERLPPSLDCLLLSDCSKLTELPPLGALEALTTLRLDSTAITSADALADLPALRDLALGYTPLKTFPESIRKLRKLETLSIQRTAIASIPDWIGEIRLKKLTVSASAIARGDKARLARLLPGAEIEVS